MNYKMVLFTMGRVVLLEAALLAVSYTQLTLPTTNFV